MDTVSIAARRVLEAVRGGGRMVAYPDPGQHAGLEFEADAARLAAFVLSDDEPPQPTDDHSRGPWRIGFGCGDQDEFFTVVDADGEAVADYIVGNHAAAMSHGRMKANAKLIAAAPTLLTACMDALRRIAEYEGRVVRLDAAIDAMRTAIRLAI